MLMITELYDAESVTFKVAGTLVGDWAAELDRCWRNAAGKASRIIVDLTEVIFVDDSGKELLSLMARAGAELIAGDILMKSIVEEITSESPTA